MRQEELVQRSVVAFGAKARADRATARRYWQQELSGGKWAGHTAVSATVRPAGGGLVHSSLPQIPNWEATTWQLLISSRPSAQSAITEVVLPTQGPDIPAAQVLPGATTVIG